MKIALSSQPLPTVDTDLLALGVKLDHLKKDAHASECLARHQHLRQSIAEAQGGLERARQKAHDDELAAVIDALAVKKKRAAPGAGARRKSLKGA